MSLKEKGIVKTALPNRAVIITERSEACNHCSAKGGCQMLGGTRENIVEVDDPIGVKPGQRVEITMESKSFLAATFLVYMLPCLGLILGAILGNYYLSPLTGLSETAGAIVGAVLLGGASLTFGLLKGKVLGNKAKYRPVISRILGEASQKEIAAAESC